MKRILLLSVIFCGTLSSQIAAEGPEFGLVYSTHDATQISYRCKSAGYDKIHCEFDKFNISRKTAEDDWTALEQDISDQLVDLDVKQFWDGLCTSEWESIPKIISGEIKAPDGARFNQASETERKDILDMFNVLDGICPITGEENLEKLGQIAFEKLLRLEFEKELRTCAVDVYEYEQVFSRRSETVWSAESTVSGESPVSVGPWV